jgi:hypothetical protein
MLLAAPTDVVAVNFFFDTLLFCGAILLLANSSSVLRSQQAVAVNKKLCEREYACEKFSFQTASLPQS